MSVLIFNPNPAFDRTVTVPELVPGAVIRTADVHIAAGGKGVNVARVLRAFGIDVPILLPVGEVDLAKYVALLEADGGLPVPIPIPGNVRLSTIYREQRSSRVTLVNDAGQELSAQTWQHVRDVVVAHAGRADIVLCMGSYPPGLQPADVEQLVRDIRRTGARVLVDTSPRWLDSAIAGGPDVAAPNLFEAEGILGIGHADLLDGEELSDDDARERALAAAVGIHERGVGHAIVTAGAAGVAFADDTGSRWHAAVRVDPVSTVGAGDSFAAGLTMRWLQNPTNTDWGGAVRWGMAAAAASCENVQPGAVDPVRVASIHAELTAQHAP